jgi:adenosylcobinamide kinase / adenosylcobinamide-phosphate guanylyltransferase
VKALILGGVRSGKSRYAEELARALGGAVVVIATGTPGDAEMAARIAAHRARRPADWSVIEEPIALGTTLCRVASPDTVIIVDCLTLWLTNLMCHGDPALLDREPEKLLNAVPALAGSLILVSNEVGSGITPVNDLARRFADAAGVLHQRLASVCERVVLMIAGLAMSAKGNELHESHLKRVDS